MLSRREFAALLAAGPLALGEHLKGLELPRSAPPRIDAARAGARRLRSSAREITLLYTNDFHSAFEPMPAFWLPESPRLGGAAHLATLVRRERAAARTSFLLDSGDMFTGTLSRLTEGEALLEMMRALGYDAMGVGNHEFDYGWQPFHEGVWRVPFPVLCANLRWADSGRRFTRPYTIVERDGARIGVIGVMGIHAGTRTIMPSKVAGLEFTDPALEARTCVAELRDDTDAIVVLAHQGRPGPMQSDAENDPSVQRSLDEDLAFCGAVPGVDVYIGAHSHHGLDEAIVHPDTGTLITQTYGYGTRVGRVRLAIDDGRVVDRDAELLVVRSDELPADPAVDGLLGRYRARWADEIGPPVARATDRFTRHYHHDSSLGSFAADVMRAWGGAEVAFTNAGGLRADLPEGDLDRGHVLDAFPFLNDAVTLELEGGRIAEVLEQGFSLRAGMVQVSGLRAWYDPERPVGQRLLRAEVQGAPLERNRRYRVTTHTFMEQGGDDYEAFRFGRVLERGPVLNELVLEHLKRVGSVQPPTEDRLVAQPGADR